MNVSLKPELERFIEEQVKAGRFATKSKVLEAGLARLMLDPMPGENDLDANDLASIDRSEKQIAGGEDLDWKDVSIRLRQEHL